MDHSSQLLKGVLDMCLLSLIDEEPSYGYEMAAKLNERGVRLVSDGTNLHLDESEIYLLSKQETEEAERSWKGVEQFALDESRVEELFYE